MTSLAGSAPANPQAFAEALSWHECHDKPHQAAVLFDGVDRNDVGVGEPCGQTRFSEKTPTQVRSLRQLGGQQLDGDRTIQRDIPGQEDDSHAPATQFPLQRIAARDGGL